MRTLIAFAVALAWNAAAIAATVSNVVADSIGDSSFRVRWDTDATFNEAQIRVSLADCSLGTGGAIIDNRITAARYHLFEATGDLSGLAPATTYFVCIEVSTDGGSTFTPSGSGGMITVATLPRIVTLPIGPTIVPTDFPAQGGVFRDVLLDCSNLQAQISAAQPGDTVRIPAGAICTGNYIIPADPLARSFLPAAVRTSDSRITLSSHGYSENQEIRFSTGGASANCLPGNSTWNKGIGGESCDKVGTWLKGTSYYAHVVDTDHFQVMNAPSGTAVLSGWIKFTATVAGSTINIRPTSITPGGYSHSDGTSITAGIPANTPIQVYNIGGGLPGGLAVDTIYYTKTACNITSGDVSCSVQVSLSLGGAAVTISSTGTGTQMITDQGIGTMYVGPAPPALNVGPNIKITTLGNMLPQGIQVGPAWDSQMYRFHQDTPSDGNPMVTFGILAHNWIIDAPLFDTDSNTDYLTTIDPRSYCGFFTQNSDVSNIVWSHMRWQGQGYPQRSGCSTLADWNGRNIAIVDSYMTGLDNWHAWSTGFAATVADTTHVTFGAGSFYAGVAIYNKTTTGTTTVTLISGGGVTGTVYVYFAMNGTLTILGPSGITLACSTAGVTCATATMVSPTWPVDGNGRMAAGKIATITLTAGSFTGVSSIDAFSSLNSTASEGTQAIIAGNGPGPFLFRNSYISNTGIPVHFDDSGSSLLRCDYLVSRNTFVNPIENLATDAASVNKVRAGNRQLLEWKSGCRIRVDGNIFLYSFAEDATCLSMVLVAREGGYMSDVDVKNNTYGPGCAGLNAPTAISAGPAMSSPVQRVHIHNNLFKIDGPKYHVAAAGLPQGYGWTMQGNGPIENIKIDHNTSLGPVDGTNTLGQRGTIPAFYYATIFPVGGMQMTDNVISYNADPGAIKSEDGQFGCGYIANKAMADCMFTSGPGNPSYAFWNALMGNWNDSVAMSGFPSAASISMAFPGLTNYIPAGLSQPANVALLKLLPSFAPRYDSPLKAGAHNSYDGRGLGVNMDQLLQAQGAIQNVRALSITASSASIAAYVPDAGTNCYAGYGTSSDVTTWTWTAANTTNSRSRSIGLSGLSAHTQYFYGLGCYSTVITPAQSFFTP